MTDLLLDRDLKLSRGSRLKLKLLVFETRPALLRYWRLRFEHALDRRALGAVNSLGRIWTRQAGTEWTEYDPHYFALMVLWRKHLSMRVICHESVHAGFCYAKRLKGRATWGGHAKEFDEETVAYPAGEVARVVVNALYEAKLLVEGMST